MSFEAKYYGSACANCEGPIRPGELVQYDEEDDVVHVDCVPTGQPRGESSSCSRCWLVHAGECA